MKLNKEGSFKHFEGKEQIQMGLDLENTHSIMSLLRNNIYSDPLKSWVREIYSNAIDAHARVNNTSDSIDVEIKTQDGGYIFIVRDYGLSMNKDVIANVYAKMGKSDKRSDNTEHGGWGLGAKSPLAYTDHFWIETWTKEEDTPIYRKWVQYIDPSRVGALSLLEEENCNNEDFSTGTKVTIPFDSKDLNAVKTALQFYLSYTDAKFNIKGKELEDLNLERFWYSHFGSNWAMNIHNEEASRYWLSEKNKGLAIVGSIPYRIDCSTLFTYFQHNLKNLLHIVDSQCPSYIKDVSYNRSLFNGFLGSLQYHEFEVNLPIGSVDLNASREDLQYTDRTCSYLLDTFYKMFLEIYTFIRIDLVEHPNFPEACIKYKNNYSGGFKRTFLSEVVWSKENLNFSSNPPIFKQSASPNYKSYVLDTVHTDGSYTSKKDILRGNKATILETGYRKYTIVIQDTEYSNFSKFIKYHAQNQPSEEKYKIEYLCIEPLDYDKVYDWIKESVPTIKLSDLVADFKSSAPVTSGNKASLGSFKTLVYKGFNIRPKAEGISSYFDYCERDVEPEEEFYYIDWEQWNNPPEFFERGCRSYSNMNTFLGEYLTSKSIPHRNLVLTKKVTRNFNSDNWINLMDLITEDYNKYKSLQKGLSLALFTCVLVEQQLPVFKKYDSKLIDHPSSMYLSLCNFYKEKSKFIEEHSEATAFFNLINSIIRELSKARQSSFYSYIREDNFGFMQKFKDEAASIYRMYSKYLDQVPLLKFHDDNRVSNYNITPENWVEYINLIEREKDLYIKGCAKSNRVTVSEFSDLINRLRLRYPLEERVA